jgi:hypothetical protein
MAAGLDGVEKAMLSLLEGFQLAGYFIDAGLMMVIGVAVALAQFHNHVLPPQVGALELLD